MLCQAVSTKHTLYGTLAGTATRPDNGPDPRPDGPAQGINNAYDLIAAAQLARDTVMISVIVVETVPPRAEQDTSAVATLGSPGQPCSRVSRTPHAAGFRWGIETHMLACRRAAKAWWSACQRRQQCHIRQRIAAAGAAHTPGSACQCDNTPRRQQVAEDVHVTPVLRQGRRLTGEMSG
jgi:hypothetical protein